MGIVILQREVDWSQVWVLKDGTNLNMRTICTTKKTLSRRVGYRAEDKRNIENTENTSRLAFRTCFSTPEMERYSAYIRNLTGQKPQIASHKGALAHNPTSLPRFAARPIHLFSSSSLPCVKLYLSMLDKPVSRLEMLAVRPSQQRDAS